MADTGRLRIEAVAQATGLSTRNIRAYQSLGLVAAPDLDGRVGRYGPAHLDRLRAVRRLQERGFSLAGIRTLFDALDRGETLAGLLGLPGQRSAVRDAAGRRPARSLQLALVPGPLAPGLSRPN